MKTEIYLAEKSDGTSYCVGFSRLPQEVNTSNPDGRLEAALNGEARDVNGTIATASFAAFQGGRAIDYVISMSGGSSIKGHDILVGHNLYVMLIVYKLENYSDSDYSNFINSFRLQ